jgi:hypothetical protein
MPKYTEEFKKKVIEHFQKFGNLWQTSKFFNLKHDTVKYWVYPEERERIKKKENEKYNKIKDDPEFKKIRNEKTKNYYKKTNRIKYVQEYNQKYKEKIKEYKTLHREKNIDRYKELARIRYEKYKQNPDFLKIRAERKEAYKKRRNELEREKYKNDPIAKLKIKIYASLHRALKNSKNSETNYSSLEYLGCTIEEFKKYIENQFEKGMTWNNNKPHKTGHIKKFWHLDHIIPLSSIDSNNIQHLKKVTHYTNYKPVWAEYNMKKYNKIDLINNPFLHFAYPKNELDKEFQIIQKRGGTLNCPACHNKIILTYQKHFYETERKMFQDPKIREFLLKNRQKYLFKDIELLTPQEVLRGFRISGLHKGFSHFSPLWFKYFIQKYNPKIVYDPCGGWGQRLLGAHLLDQYIYNDLDSRTVEACKLINKDFLPLKKEENAIFYNQRAEIFTPEEEYDTVFSCPPYYNKETYMDKTFKNLKDFTDWFAQVAKTSTKDFNINSVGIVMGDAYGEIIKKPFLENGYSLLEESGIFSLKDHFSLKKKAKTKSKEVLYVFGKKEKN